MAEAERRDINGCQETFQALDHPLETSNGGNRNDSISDPSDSSGPSSLSSTPCLDILLSENVLAHTLATSRMPVRRKCLLPQPSFINCNRFGFFPIDIFGASRHDEVSAIKAIRSPSWWIL